VIEFKRTPSLDALIETRVEFLTQYQNAAYAQQYRDFVEQVRTAERGLVDPKPLRLTEAVARYLFKLMAYKDEYEVARLYSDTHFINQVMGSFDGDLKLEFHLAPPLFARKNKVTGEPQKMTFGPWMLSAFRVLSKFRFLRGTPLDIFGYTAERKTERGLIAEYEAMLGEITANLTPANHATAVALAAIPEKIRGFGHVKARHLAAAKAEEKMLREQFRTGGVPILKAAE
jgi:indolepyruvate ferredoxin oxidoreductase